jgi:putative endopeptidase
VAGGLHVQGDLVVGEAAADLGGLILGWRALHALPAAAGGGAIGGGAEDFTADQQYFIAFAHSWASHIRSEHAQELVISDPHPPNEFRANGSLANDAEFQAAFQIPDPSPMVRHERCVIW